LVPATTPTIGESWKPWYTGRPNSLPDEGPVEDVLGRSCLQTLVAEIKIVNNKAGNNLKVGELAQLLGVSTSLVRSWEKLGLATAERSQGKHRLFSGDDLQVLRRALYLRNVQGLNAPAILNLLRQDGLLKYKDAGTGEVQSSIGPRLRKLRLQRGTPLSTVAAALGVSKGFLGNLERSRTGASVSTLRKLARYFELDILDLFNPLDGAGPQLRPRDRKTVDAASGVRMELLASGKVAMEPHLFRVAPGAGSGESHAHGGEEFLYLLRGRLAIVLASEKFQLRTGDSFYFDSATQHQWLNPGKTKRSSSGLTRHPLFEHVSS
jgi:DNA-binding transcriptional MerR regulator/mannose-6-phosphate isomerase-like protein (cupin superfamily)